MEIATGRLFVDPASRGGHDLLKTPETPLVDLPFERLCPGAKALEALMAVYRWFATATPRPRGYGPLGLVLVGILGFYYLPNDRYLTIATFGSAGTAWRQGDTSRMFDHIARMMHFQKRGSVDHRETDASHRNGCPPYPATLVISSERSGLNLLRHAVEYAAGRRTPGKTHILREGPLAFHRTHWANARSISPARTPLRGPDGEPLYRRLILLLRDPREILPRAYDGDMERMADYCDNLLAFHHFRGEKLLVTYDDLVTRDEVFQEIFAFLQLPTVLELARVPEIRSVSVQWYEENQTKGGGSQTHGDPQALRQHQQKLSSDQIQALRDLLDTRLGGLVHTYLGKWVGPPAT